MEKFREVVGPKKVDDSLSSQDNDHERLLPKERRQDSEEGSETAFHDTRQLRRPWIQWILSMMLFCLYSILLALYVSYISTKSSDLQCAKQLSVWSPLNDVIEYEEVSVENAFAHQTVYRGPPTPKLEKAWDELWHMDVVPFPEEKLALVNRSAVLEDGRSLQPAGEGYGAQFEVFHQLHCLNLIRQHSWRDWYFRHPDIVKTPSSMLASDVGTRMHVDHCIEALRIALMCHGDTTPFFTILDPSAPMGARADFSPHRKCRNFEQLHSWTKENEISNPAHNFEPKKGQA